MLLGASTVYLVFSLTSLALSVRETKSLSHSLSRISWNKLYFSRGFARGESKARAHPYILAREFETNKEIFRSRPSLRSCPHTSAVFGPVVALGTILGMVIEKTHDNDSMAIVRESKAKRERTPFHGKRIRNLQNDIFRTRPSLRSSPRVWADEALYASWCACGLFAVGHGFYLLPDAADALRLGAAVSVRREREAREGGEGEGERQIYGLERRRQTQLN